MAPADVAPRLVDLAAGWRADRDRRGAVPRDRAERLRRLLVMLPWLMERGEVPLAEMAARFELTEAELVGDLELAALCGLPPFIDEMIDVFIDEGVVFLSAVPSVHQYGSLRARGLALLSQAGQRCGFPAPDPRRAGEGSARQAGRGCWSLTAGSVDVRSHQQQRPCLRPSTTQRQARRRLLVGQPGGSTERSHLRSIFLDRGHWYVIADDSRSGESRTFPHRPLRRLWERTRGAIVRRPRFGRRCTAEWRRVVRRRRRAVGSPAPGAAGSLGC